MYKYILIAFILLFYSCEDNKTTNELLVKARKEYNSNNYERAILLYNNIIQKDSSIGEAYYSRAYCEAQVFEMEKSINDFNKSIQLKYRVSDSYFCLGLNYRGLFKDSIACKYFVLAYKSNPNDTIALKLIKSMNCYNGNF